MAVNALFGVSRYDRLWTLVRAVLAAWDCDDPDEVAVLLTSEVVANAVRHAATACAVRVNLEGDLLRVEVADGSPALPRLRSPGPNDFGGRGLLLVESFARRRLPYRDRP